MTRSQADNQLFPSGGYCAYLSLFFPPWTAPRDNKNITVSSFRPYSKISLIVQDFIVLPRPTNAPVLALDLRRGRRRRGCSELLEVVCLRHLLDIHEPRLERTTSRRPLLGSLVLARSSYSHNLVIVSPQREPGRDSSFEGVGGTMAKRRQDFAHTDPFLC